MFEMHNVIAFVEFAEIDLRAVSLSAMYWRARMRGKPA